MTTAAEVRSEEPGLEDPNSIEAELRNQVRLLEQRVLKGEERRRGLIHIMGALTQLNKRLGDQRKAMLHILQDSHQSNLRLERSRKAMIHIMDDLRETTEEMQRREQELRDKQEQLVQAGKLATLGELTTGVAHELNNPLNNIGLFVGNAIDLMELGSADRERCLQELSSAMQQVRKAAEIISHLRTFGHPAPVIREPVAINEVIQRALSLMQEQMRLRQIDVHLNLCQSDPVVIGNAIQLEQVFINLLTNARDAVGTSPQRAISIECAISHDVVELAFSDTGPGIPKGLEQRIFDPFFTTKEVGRGTGLGLSITYGIVKEHNGTITVAKKPPGEGSTFVIQLQLANGASKES